MPILRCQRRPLPAPRSGLQSRQFHADAGHAEDGGAVVADQLAREADQDRRQGRQPRPVCDLPDGRGRGAAADVPGNPVADRPAAGTAGRRHDERWRQMQQTTAAEVRLDAGRAARFSASVRSTGGFDRLPRTRCAICRCSRRPKGRSWSRNDPESGECRLKTSVQIGLWDKMRVLRRINAKKTVVTIVILLLGSLATAYWMYRPKADLPPTQNIWRSVSWRLQLYLRKAEGDIPDLSWSEL